jgi:hypothetical protein
MVRRAMSIAISAVIVVAVSGCAAPGLGTRPVSLPDGQQGYALKCSGTLRDFGDCMNEAAEACHGPYQIVDENGEHVGGVVAPVGNGAAFVHAIHRTMIVECGGTPPQKVTAK